MQYSYLIIYNTTANPHLIWAFFPHTLVCIYYIYYIDVRARQICSPQLLVFVSVCCCSCCCWCPTIAMGSWWCGCKYCLLYLYVILRIVYSRESILQQYNYTLNSFYYYYYFPSNYNLPTCERYNYISS